MDPAAAAPTLDALGRVHFIGIGGAGMSAIARILLSRGVRVSGSDARDSDVLGVLRALGADVHVGHAADNVGAADTVVVSSAIRPANPEYARAVAEGLRILHRADALAVVMAGRRAVAVSGTHGKTTTTSMLTVALQACGADPSYAIGGDLAATGLNGYDGSGELFVAEADESDSSFLRYTPEVAVVTNVEADHLDHYGTPEAVHAAFGRFVRQVTPGGFAVICGDDPGGAALAASARADGIDVRSYGEAADCTWRIVDLHGSSFELVGEAGSAGRVALQVPGHHNVLNAAAALVAGLGLGFAADGLRAGLADFTGARRRFELVGEAGGVRVYDDYAHHPTELAAVLRTARELAGGGRLVAVFQPHLYSRTRFFAAEFGNALALADQVVVMDVYAAREEPEPGVTGRLIAQAVPMPAARVYYEPSRAAVPSLVSSLCRSGDLVLTIGAGDVTALAPEILKLLAAS